ncbi:hypothetical protein ACRC7T_13925 [Segnochrobactraceae bacterium EtOH-i3]
MAGFYDDMASMVAELLAPETAGGLGQGTVTLTRMTAGTPDPTAPWDPVAGTTETVPLLAAVRGAGRKWVDGETILATDLQAIIAVPAIMPVPGDVVTRDGDPLTVIRVQRYPEAGTIAAVLVFLRA